MEGAAYERDCFGGLGGVFQDLDEEFGWEVEEVEWSLWHFV